MSESAHLIVATCSRGIESILADELRAFGANSVSEGRGAVSCLGDQALALSTCLWSRTAARVLWPLVELDASSAESLYASVLEFDYAAQFPLKATLAIDVVGKNANLVHSQFVAQKAKDAICDRIKAEHGSRPSVDLITPDVRLNLRIVGDRAQLALDLAGAPLHQRGYRVAQADAPLKENLAAAILLKAKWPERARRGESLLDPMCGSGTFLVEGALMAADVAPQLGRLRFGFAKWLALEQDTWQRIFEDAKARAQAGLEGLKAVFFGADIDAKALGFAREAAARAGLDGRIDFQLQDLSTPIDTPSLGLLVCNPPYGERLMDRRQALKVHERLGAVLANAYACHDAAVLTLDRELAEALDRPIKKAFKLYNGPLECALFLLAPHRVGKKNSAAATNSEASKQLESVAPTAATLSAASVMVANRIRKNMRHLKSWVAREGISAYRIYDADLPEYAAAIDKYGDAISISEYRAPKTIPEETARARFEELKAAVASVFDSKEIHLHLKLREQKKGSSQYEKRGTDGEFFAVIEGGLKFLINLTDYLDSGLFLDHRLTRQLVRERSRNARVLNLFSYTGAFSVYAAAGGAREVVSVDLSPTYTRWAQDNFRINGIDLKRHVFIEGDVIEFVQTLDRDFDVIICDPPTFSNSKRTDSDFDVQRDHAWLLETLAEHLAPGGTMYFSTNFRRFVPDPDTFDALGAVELTPRSIPPDFARSPKIHRCWRIDCADA